MRIAGFSAELTPNGQIPAPPEVAAQVPPRERHQVVLQWGVSEDDTAWRAEGRRRFDAAYAADDSVYEQLMDTETTP